MTQEIVSIFLSRKGEGDNIKKQTHNRPYRLKHQVKNVFVIAVSGQPLLIIHLLFRDLHL